MVQLSSDLSDNLVAESWSQRFDDTTVYVERVIAYWSWTFKSAEVCYSTTKHEALVLKEGLVKFQPFVEGEKLALITDHAALQWAKTYKNTNRRLAAWGTVFSTYAPNLSIIHWPRRKHSNVDLLSRLYRAPPPHNSPGRDDSVPLEINPMHIDASLNPSLGKVAFSAFRLIKCLEEMNEVWLKTRSVARKEEEMIESNEQQEPLTIKTMESVKDQTDEYWGATNPPPNMHVHLHKTVLEEWLQGYKTDAHLAKAWNDPKTNMSQWTLGHQYFKDDQGLMFFRDTDYQPRLCVPISQCQKLLEEAHELAYEGTHQGPEKLWQKLSIWFYWKRMKADILKFVQTCDVCQKIKPSNFNRYGYLIPNLIPSRPYQSVAMDFIVNLPWLDGYNAIHVMVDRLTKHGTFSPTTTRLNAEDFSTLFVKKIVCQFGPPESIICDHDQRWTSDFWNGVAKFLQTKMSLSSSHHPQPLCTLEQIKFPRSPGFFD